MTLTLDELIRSRRTIQQFTRDQISDEVVRSALALGVWAPNHKLTQPWRYIQLGPDARLRLADLALEHRLKKAKEPMTVLAQNAIRETILKPSHLIALSMVRSADEGRLWEDYAAIACGVQNISLKLWESGIGTKWSTSGFTTHSQTYELLGVDPVLEKLVGLLMIGRPERVPPASPRLELDKILRTTT